MAPLLQSFGFSQDAAQQMAELNAALNSGHVDFARGDVRFLRGTTSIDEVLGQLLRARAS